MSDQKPTRLPLVATPSNRGQAQDKDAKLINGFIENTPMGELWCYKRPGLARLLNVVPGGAAAGGIYYYTNSIISIFGAQMYEGVLPISAVADCTNNPYSFEGYLSATPQVFFHNRTNAYTMNGFVVTAVVDPDYPAAVVPGAVYIDGTMYVMTPDAYILGSDLNDASSWDPNNSIRAQISSDNGVAIAKQLNYLVAFKDFSTEVFYDAGNATGSPLGRVEAAALNIGCFGANTVKSIDGLLFWVGASKGGNFCVMMMEGLKAKSISTPAIERVLQAGVLRPSHALTFRVSGHRFYLLSFLGTSLGTFVYDIGEQMWYEWQSPLGGPVEVFDSYIDGNFRPVLQDHSDGNLYAISQDIYQDDGLDFAFDLVTPIFDGGARLKKTVNLLEVATDQQTGSVLRVRVSDDDYQTWSNWRDLDLGLERPMLPNMGTFRKRAHHFYHKANLPLRIKSVDLHADMGTL